MKTVGPKRCSVPMLMAVAAGLPGALAGAANGQTLTWQNAAGGAASTAGNWSPAQVPSGANALVWNLASTYGVTFGASTGASLGHTYRRGTVTLTMTSPHTAGTGGIVVGDLNGDNATTTLSGGAWNSSGHIVVGDGLGSTGRLTVSSASADLGTTGTGRLIVGNDGNGTLTVSSLGSVVVADRLFVADGPGSVGSVTVTGGQAAPPFAHSTLVVNSLAESRIGSTGDGTMSVVSGGTATFAGNLTVGAVSGSDSTLTIDGTALPLSSVSVAGDLNIARNTTRLTQAGNGRVVVQGAGRLVVGGAINIENDPDGQVGNGEVLVNGSGARVLCESVVLGPAGNLLIDAGEVRVRGGALQAISAFLVRGNATGGLASLVLSEGAAMDVPLITIAAFGPSELRVESGSDLAASDAVVTGNEAAPGDLIVTGAGSTASVGDLRLALSGGGGLLVEAGGLVTTESMTIGEQPTGGGSIEVRGGVVRVSEDVIVGGRRVGSGFFNGGGSSVVVDATGVLDVTGNVYRFGNSSFDLEGGTINAGEFHTAIVNFASPIRARGAINARIFGELAAITATGPLTLGLPEDDSISDLRVEVGSHTVTCLGGEVPIELRSVTMAGGVLEGSPGFRLFQGGTISGRGRISQDIRSSGTITSSGGTLVFAGDLDSETGSMGGERFEFLTGSTFRGKPAGSRWRAHPGTRMTFSDLAGGPMVVGSAVPDAFVCEGELTIEDDLIVIDQDGIETGPRCTFVSAAMAVETGSPGFRGDIRLKTRNGVRDLLCGRAGIFTGTLRNGGTVSPGANDGAGVALMLIEGNYSQSCDGVAGELVIDITGPVLDQVDRVSVRGTMEVDGTIVIRVAPGFVPENGFRIAMVAAGSIVGGIDRVEIPPGWSLERTVQNLNVVYCAPDFNSDGFVDFFDYLEFAACFEGEFCAGGATADFNGDGFVDFFDYDAYVIAFELGC